MLETVNSREKLRILTWKQHMNYTIGTSRPSRGLRKCTMCFPFLHHTQELLHSSGGISRIYSMKRNKRSPRSVSLSDRQTSPPLSPPAADRETHRTTPRSAVASSYRETVRIGERRSRRIPVKPVFSLSVFRRRP